MDTTAVWTVLPHGRVGKTLHLSIHVGHRLTTTTGKPSTLAKFPDALDWPASLAGADIALEFSSGDVVPVTWHPPHPSAKAWGTVFTGDVPVNSWQLTDFADREVVSWQVGPLVDYIGELYAGIGAHAPYHFPHWGHDGPLGSLSELGTILGGDPNDRPRPGHEPGNGDGGRGGRGGRGGDHDRDEVEIEVTEVETTTVRVRIDEDGDRETVEVRHTDEVDVEIEVEDDDRRGRGRGTRRPSAARSPRTGAAVTAPTTPAMRSTIPPAPTAQLRAPFGATRVADAIADGTRPYSTTIAALPRPATLSPSTRSVLDAMACNAALVPQHGLDTAPVMAPPTPDFHQLESLLGQHPALLRHFGLALDVTVTLPKGLPATGEVRVRVTLPAAPAVTLVCPWTAYTLGASTFLAAPAPGSDYADGLLTLDDVSRFRVTDLECDSLPHRLVTFLASRLTAMSRFEFARTRVVDIPDAEASPPPALRGDGLMVVRDDRAGWFSGRRARPQEQQADLEAGTDVVLHYDDLVRGHRLDVQAAKASAPWRSLHHRHGTVHPAKSGLTAVTDEGYADSAPVASRMPSKTDDTPPLVLHEAVAGWRGWSLAVPPPGSAIPDPGTTPAPPAGSIAGRLEVDYAVPPGTLPRLRYGQRYRVRIRAVDLAGNSVTKPATGHESDWVTLRRYEPVPHPTVALVHPVSEGESVQRLVIRSDGEGGTTNAYVTALKKLGLTGYRAVAARHLVAPKASEETVERHGLLDAAFGPHAKAGHLWALATREAGTLYDPATNPHVVAPPGEKPANLGKLRRGDPLPDGQYVVHPGASFVAPWLPDPLAARAVLLDDTSATVLDTVQWSGSWPKLRTARLTLTDKGATPPAGLSVGVPAGRTRRIRVASALGAAADLNLLGAWAFLDAATQQSVRAAARNGRMWLLTPYLEVDLVHATQKPIADPTLALDPDPVRERSSHQAVLTGTVTVDGPSTAHVDVDALWWERVDQPGTPPSLSPHVGHVGRVQVTREDAATDGSVTIALPTGDGALVQTFPDTRHREIAYIPAATSRFREYFPPAVLAQRDALIRRGPEDVIHVPASARPTPPAASYATPLFVWDRAGKPAPRSTRRTGLRIWLRRPWWTSGDGERLGVLTSGGDAPAPDHYVSQWGLDPVWSSPALRTLDVGAFDGDAADRVGPLVLTAPPTSPGGHEVTVGTVNVTTYPVNYDPVSDAYFADVLVNTGDTYAPFIRLSLARYQEHALDGLQLSTSVTLDVEGLTPSRDIDLRKGKKGDPLTLSVSGAAGRNAGIPDNIPSRIITAQVEEFDPATGGDLGWTPLGTPVLVDTRPKQPWTASIPVPPGSGTRRVTVVEREVWATDTARSARPAELVLAAGSLSVGPTGTPVLAGTAAAPTLDAALVLDREGTQQFPVETRIIYVETLPMP